MIRYITGSVIVMFFLEIFSVEAATWSLLKKPQLGEKQILLNDLPYEYNESGIVCSINAPSVLGKGKRAWMLRTIKCVKGDAEVSTDVSCGGTHGSENGSGFLMKIGSAMVQPTLICEGAGK